MTSLYFRWGALVVAALALTFVVGRVVQNNIPVYTTGSDVPDAAQNGDPDAAMKQSHELLDALRQANWQYSRLPHSLLQLPDRKMSENPSLRRDNVSSFAFPHKQPEFSEVAFTSSVYVRRSISRYKTDKGWVTKGRPSGFFIVAFKNGEIRRVPPQEARLYPSPSGRLLEIYPGMDEWREDLEQLPYVSNAPPQSSQALAAAAKALTKKEKPTQIKDAGTCPPTQKPTE